MIQKNKIEEAAELYTGISLKLLVPEAEITNTAEDLYNYSILDFKSGVEFAEKELENLATEFAEWILQHKDPSFGIIGGYKSSNRWMDTIQGNRIDYTTQELFEIFKKENYDTNK